MNLAYTRKEVMQMRLQWVFRISAAGFAVLALSGTALADTVDIGTTGSGSTQTVTITNTNTSTVTNTNTVEVTTVNEQRATSGDVNVCCNTVVSGPVASGNATNTAVQTTVVNISNQVASKIEEAPKPPVKQVEEEKKVEEQPKAKPVPAVLGAQAIGGKGAGVGAAAAELPRVGAKQPIDVSALRALYQPPIPVSGNPGLAKAGRNQTMIWLILASVLCMAGAIGTTVRAQRQTRNT